MKASGGDDVSEITRSTYDAARDYFDAAPLRFWERYGKRTVARAELRTGARVLDVCSGTGASALAAAHAVGPLGRVVAVDLSSSLLHLAAQKAERAGLRNVEFRVADMAQIDGVDAEGSFDAVFVVFGIFFAPDMVSQLRKLARMLRPGGTIAVTTWGPRLFEPLYGKFLEEIRRSHHQSLEDEYRPWDRITTPQALHALMEAAGLTNIEITTEPGEEILEQPTDWWSIILGTGLRWFVDQLDPKSAEAVRVATLEHARSIQSIETNVIYAVARTNTQHNKS